MGFWKKMGSIADAVASTHPVIASVEAKSAIRRTEERYQARERVDPVFRQQREQSRQAALVRRERRKDLAVRGAKGTVKFTRDYALGKLIDKLRGE